jgi:ubiquinone biosynthesis protein UbiJ
LLSHLAAAPVNHVLRAETWALRRLQAFVGRTARFEVPPAAVVFTVVEGGEVLGAPPETPADVTFRCTPPVALRIFCGDEQAYRQVEVTGDAEFAQAVQYVVHNARWDAEEDLSRIIGDVAAHRVSRAAQGLLRAQARAAASLVRNIRDYLVEERPLIARRSDVQAFVRSVDELRDDAERIAQRIARLRA